MNSKIKRLTRNFSYTFLANILSMIISTILVLIVPGFIGVNEYGYWQLYIFYTSYISYMSLGLTDGVYLRYGGLDYESLEKSVFISQYWFLVLFNIIMNFSIAFFYVFNSSDLSKSIVVILTCITGILVVPRSLITFILQATNRIKEYSIILIMERIIYFVIVIILLLSGVKRFQYIILADIIGKLCSVIYSIFICNDLVFGKIASIKIIIKEIRINISVGIKLLFANLASMLIIGVVRLFIENRWDIETFGKVSLTLSISNMLMMFINTVGIVLFPALRRTSKEILPNIYDILRTIIIIPLIGMIFFYYPAKIILSNWLPRYAESLTYMALIFPMCLYESKMLLLINTYFKVLRKEKLMMIINIITVIIGVVLSYISAFILNNLKLTILIILILLAFRCIIAELSLSKILNINVKRDIVLEMFMTIIFVYISWNLDINIAMIIYCIAYGIYLIIVRNDIIYLLKNIRTICKINKDKIN